MREEQVRCWVRWRVLKHDGVALVLEDGMTKGKVQGRSHRERRE